MGEMLVQRLDQSSVHPPVDYPNQVLKAAMNDTLGDALAPARVVLRDSKDRKKFGIQLHEVSEIGSYTGRSSRTSSGQSAASTWWNDSHSEKSEKCPIIGEHFMSGRSAAW